MRAIMNPPKPPCAPGKNVWKFSALPLTDAKQKPAMTRMSAPFSQVKKSWKSPALRMPR